MLMVRFAFSAPGTHLRVSAVCEASLPLARNALHSPASRLYLPRRLVCKSVSVSVAIGGEGRGVSVGGD